MHQSNTNLQLATKLKGLLMKKIGKLWSFFRNKNKTEVIEWNNINHQTPSKLFICNAAHRSVWKMCQNIRFYLPNWLVSDGQWTNWQNWLVVICCACSKKSKRFVIKCARKKSSRTRTFSRIEWKIHTNVKRTKSHSTDRPTADNKCYYFDRHCYRPPARQPTQTPSLPLFYSLETFDAYLFGFCYCC